MSKIRAFFVLFFAVFLSTLAHAAGPVISAIAVSASTGSTATITWTTSPAATSQVLFGVGNTNQSTTVSASLVTSHSVILVGLNQQTVYSYKVVSTDSGGSTTSSANTFALCNPGNPNSGFTTVNIAENASYVTGAVTATWTDNSGVSTSSPTVCGNTFSTTPTGTVGLPGNLTMRIPDNNYVIPSPSSWIFTQSNASGLSANLAVTGPVIDLTTGIGLQASATGPGAGVIAFFGNTGTITALTDPTTIVDSLGNSIAFSSTGLTLLDATSDGCVLSSGTSPNGIITCEDNALDKIVLTAGSVFLQDGAGDTCTLTAGTFTCNVPIGSGPSVKSATVSLTSAQVNALTTTPIAIGPVPTSGTFVYPVSLLLEYTAGSTPFSVSGVTIFLGFTSFLTDGNQDWNSLSASTFIDQTTSQLLGESGGAGTPLILSVANGKQLAIAASGGTISAGNGTLKVTVFYTIQTI